MVAGLEGPGTKITYTCTFGDPPSLGDFFPPEGCFSWEEAPEEEGSGMLEGAGIRDCEGLLFPTS